LGCFFFFWGLFFLGGGGGGGGGGVFFFFFWGSFLGGGGGGGGNSKPGAATPIGTPQIGLRRGAHRTQRWISRKSITNASAGREEPPGRASASTRANDGCQLQGGSTKGQESGSPAPPEQGTAAGAQRVQVLLKTAAEEIRARIAHRCDHGCDLRARALPSPPRSPCTPTIRQMPRACKNAEQFRAVQVRGA